ncbi:recombinase family protein [Clostridium sp. LY3-2]|uniref:recombinase family protein n=1 Tax=Clostridium sp. LY3-2 TaxID=2942482 RepID=UPI0021538064|nr:recombinase family protein [Clostridium sp. LY3-2]MCR6515337.1 recombinase family protein [Clostridium sp. LY3-2]
MKKIALYCRVSSDDQKERETIENQVEILRTYVDMHNDLQITYEYLDDGVSGTIAFENRPAGNKLITDAKIGLFDCILVYKIDRFGRDTLSGLSAIETLRKYNIEIMSVTEPFDLNTPTGRFQFITYLNMAELERNNILDRMFIGATRAAKAGKWLGGIVPYGYIVNKDGYLEICEKEADVVRKIYDLYVNEKIGSYKIASYLNSIKIPSSCASGKGKRTKNVTNKWRSNSIRRILSSSVYKGTHIYGKRASRRTEVIERKVPAIIDSDLWNLAQEQKKTNSNECIRNKKTRDYYLSGLIKCKRCGKSYYGISYKKSASVYACSGKRSEINRSDNNKCDNLNVNCDYIEENIWTSCVEILNSRKDIIKYYKNNKLSAFESIDSDLDNVTNSLSNLSKEKDKVISLYKKELLTDEEIEVELKKIKKEKQTLNELYSTLKQKKDLFLSEDKTVNDIETKLELFYSNLNNKGLRSTIIKFLIDKILIDYVIQDGKKVVVVDVYYNFKLDNCTDRDLKLQLASLCLEILLYYLIYLL